MPLDPITLGFPANFVACIGQALARVPGVSNVDLRPLKPSDVDGTATCFAMAWTPGVMNIGQEEPIWARYPFIVEYLTKFLGDQAEGHAIHSSVSKYIRAMLYRDEGLNIQLRQLRDDLAGVRETFKRLYVQRQDFYTNRTANNSLVFLSSLSGFIEVETTDLG